MVCIRRWFGKWLLPGSTASWMQTFCISSWWTLCLYAIVFFFMIIRGLYLFKYAMNWIAEKNTFMKLPVYIASQICFLSPCGLSIIFISNSISHVYVQVTKSYAWCSFVPCSWLVRFFIWSQICQVRERNHDYQ